MTPHPVVIFFQMITGWSAYPVINFFSNDNRIWVSFGSHFQIKMMDETYPVLVVQIEKLICF